MKYDIITINIILFYFVEKKVRKHYNV